MKGIVRDLDGRSSVAGKVLSALLSVLLAFGFLNFGLPAGEAVADDATGEVGYRAAVPQSDLAGGQGDYANPSIAFDEATGTLTISGYETLAPADVAAYKGKVEKLIIRNVGIIGGNAFRNFSTIKDIAIQNVGVIESDTSTQHYTFAGCTALETLSIDGAETIGAYTFWYTPNLRSAVIKNVGTIEPNCFSPYLGFNLTDLTLENVDTIGDYAFQGHSKLANLTMSNVGTVGFQAFMNCSSLTGVLELNKSNAAKLGKSSFLGCTGLTGVDLDGVEVDITAFYGCTGLKTATVKNADAIGTQAFTGCTGLESAELTNIKTIGVQAFSIYGNNAQPACTALKRVAMSGIDTIGTSAFYGCTGLQTAALKDIGTIGQYAFRNCTSLQTVGIDAVDGVGVIDNYAFWWCTNLKSISNLKGVESIGGFAFYGCENLKGLTIDDITKMGFVGGAADVMDRVQQILAGRFTLTDAEAIAELTPDAGWDASSVGRSDNWNTYDNGTQIMQQARWQQGDSAVAEVQVDAYYTGKRQMDYIFVADLSASMAQLGNPDDSNARFYDMQSKLLDMTGQLLGTSGYDCQVAMVTFGGYFNKVGSVNVLDFTSDASQVRGHINALAPLNENTDYALGLNKALELVGNHGSDRETVVVFLSDGRPTYDGQTQLKTVAQLAAYDTKIAGIAQQMKNAGAKSIYGVLHSPGSTAIEYAHNAMNAVCDDYYMSTDTDSFGKAMNAAFAAAYGKNTVTVPVNVRDFQLGALNVSAGEAVYDEAAGAILWTLNDMPFGRRTLSYTMSLTPENAARTGTHQYFLNSANARFDNQGGASAGLSLALSRTVAEPVVMGSYRIVHEYYTNGQLDGTYTEDATAVVGSRILAANVPSRTEYDGATYVRAASNGSLVVTVDGNDALTLRYDRTVTAPPADDNPPAPATPGDQGGTPGPATPAAPDGTVPADGAAPAAPADGAAAVAAIPDDGTPLAAGADEEPIVDDENPLGAFDEVHCWMHWLMIAGLLLTAAYGLAVIRRRLGQVNDIDDMEDRVIGRRRQGSAASAPVPSASRQAL